MHSLLRMGVCVRGATLTLTLDLNPTLMLFGMDERCGHDTKTVYQLQQTYFGVNGSKQCGLYNQSCVLQYRCFGNNGQHGRETYTPYQDPDGNPHTDPYTGPYLTLSPYQDIQNQSIATFLMAMGPYSYYGGGSETGIGPQACYP